MKFSPLMSLLQVEPHMRLNCTRSSFIRSSDSWSPWVAVGEMLRLVSENPANTFLLGSRRDPGLQRPLFDPGLRPITDAGGKNGRQTSPLFVAEPDGVVAPLEGL